MWWWRLWWRRRRGWWWWWPCLVIYDPPAGNEPNLLNQAIMVGEYFYMISWYDNMISYTFVGLQDTSIWQGILQYLGLFRFHIIFIWCLVCNRQGFIVGNFGVNTNYLKSNCNFSRSIRLKSIAWMCQGCTNRCSLAAGLRGNEERMRKWRGNGEEMEREWGNGEKISSFFLYILPLYPFPISKLVTFCRKMLNTAFLSQMSQNTEHTRYEEIILASAEYLPSLLIPSLSAQILWFRFQIPCIWWSLP